MKITKRQLKRIIKEERARLIKEQSPAAGPDYIKDARDWIETLGQLIDQDMTSRNVDLRDEGRELVEALESLRREYQDEMRGSFR